MRFLLTTVQTFIVAIGILSFGPQAFGQLHAPGRNWAGITQYLGNAPQDSIFVYFANPSQTNVGKLSAQFSDGSTSTFQWYKYNPSPSIVPANRFQLFLTQTGLNSSLQENLTTGGYRVVITRDADNVVETYTAWLFEDKVVISSIFVDNQCDFLYLEAMSVPDRFTIENDYFTYYDLSRTTHPPKNELGRNYFQNSTWSTPNSLITLPSTNSLSISVSDPAPLYDASYKLDVISLFGKSFSAETPTIIAKAIKDEVIIEIMDDNNEWVAFDKSKEYEALLELRIGINILANVKIDSLYTYVYRKNEIDGPVLMEKIWADSSKHAPTALATSLYLYPLKQLFVPGNYLVVHRAKNRTAGCTYNYSIPDDGQSFIRVAKSELKIEGIPNVFSPNGDGQNDFFVIKEPDTNLKSMAYFTIHIHNRWGKRVYSYTGDPRNWEGWNGKVEITNANAPEGVYYYVIEAVGWDGKKFQGGPYKGFMYLFRGN